jgi:hypothetical protein
MYCSVFRRSGVILAWAIALVLNTELGVAATITQATVTTDLPSQSFDFEIVWSSAPNFAATDSFKYNILNPATAGNCCSPFSGWSGFAASNADYQIIEQGGNISLYSGNDTLGRTLIGNIPFALTGNILDFAIAFSLLNEPNGFTYELENFFSGSFDGLVLVGSSNGIAAGVPAVPLPAALPLFATGLGALALFGWRRSRRVQRSDLG